MDPVSTAFAREAVLREIDNCRDIDALKRVTKSLVAHFFASRTLIAHQLLASIKPITNPDHNQP
jgi:hypothetical protein